MKAEISIFAKVFYRAKDNIFKQFRNPQLKVTYKQKQLLNYWVTELLNDLKFKSLIQKNQKLTQQFNNSVNQ
jgi:hypothetical protein